MKTILFVLLLCLPFAVSATDYDKKLLAGQCLEKGDRIISANQENTFNFGYSNNYIEVLHNGVLVERFQSKGVAWELTHDAVLCVGKRDVSLRFDDKIYNGVCLPHSNKKGAKYFLQMQNDGNFVAYIDSYKKPGTKLQVRWALSYGKNLQHMGWWKTGNGGSCAPFP